MDFQQKQREQEKAYDADQMSAQNQQNMKMGMGIAGSGYRPSPAEEAEQQAAEHLDRAGKAQQAAAFLRAHPEFDEFIQLIRKGVIGI